MSRGKYNDNKKSKNKEPKKVSKESANVLRIVNKINLDRDHFLEKDLYLGLVEYFENGKAVTDIHVLTNISENEAYDLVLNQHVMSEGDKEIFFPQTLIPFSVLNMNSRIIFHAYNREDALKAGFYHKERYLRFLRLREVSLTLEKK